MIFKDLSLVVFLYRLFRRLFVIKFLVGYLILLSFEIFDFE